MFYTCLTLFYNNITINICSMKQKRTANALYKYHVQSRYNNIIWEKLFCNFWHNLTKFRVVLFLRNHSYFNILYRIVEVKQVKLIRFTKYTKFGMFICHGNSLIWNNIVFSIFWTPFNLLKFKTMYGYFSNRINN